MKNILTRSLSGIVFAIILLGSLILNKYLFGIVFLAIVVLCLTEFQNLLKYSCTAINKITVLLTGTALFCLSFLVASGAVSPKFYFLLTPFLLLFFIEELFSENEHALENIAFGLSGIIYIALPLSLVNFLVFQKDGMYSPNLMIALLALVWSYDSGAYLFGVTFGKHRLFERISPKKSWEGVIGGALLALIASLIIARLIPGIHFAHWLVMALLIVVFATLGDLFESLLKRKSGVKDSGNIIPGHGGMLDRFDSLLFAIPVVVCYILLLL